MATIAARIPIAKNRLVILLATIAVAIGQFTYPARADSGQAEQLLTLSEARIYMLELINRDRASLGVAPVLLDCVANRAAQAHSDEMAEWGYISHWDIKGRKPVERYCDEGGRGAVFENVYTNHNNPYSGRRSSLEKAQLFPKKEVEQAEAWFFNQEAPRDGHRRNILERHHKLVGIGLSLAHDRPFGKRITVAQEFVNQGGEFSDLASDLTAGEKTNLMGRLDKGLALHAVQVCREDLATPMTPYDLKQMGSYHLPSAAVTSYYPRHPLSPSPISMTGTAEGEEFALTVSLDKSWKEGLYYVIVWVRDPRSQETFIGSTRTVRVTAPVMGPIAATRAALPRS